MGMFNKLFGDAVKAIENAANEIATDAAKDAIKKEFSQEINAVENAGREIERAAEQQQMNSVLEESPDPSGFSWGSEMPSEENQFNFGGSYRDYFEKIFREDFADLTVAKEIPDKYPNRTVYRLSRAGSTALVVELLPESSATKKLRKECQAQGIPYVRFYYDHDGWWNTRAYVCDRIRKALG